MSTRVKQFPELMVGIRNGSTILSGGSVEFYEAGTSTSKNVWTEKEKTNAYTSYTLDSDGAAQLYGQGDYKLIIKNSSGTTVFTWDNYKIEYPGYSVVSVSSSPYTHKASDSVLVVDTSSGNITVNLLAAASWIQPLTIKNTDTNNVIIDADGSELIKWSGMSGSGDATYTLSSQHVGIKLFSDDTSIHMTDHEDTFDSKTMTNSTVDSTPIGGTTAAAGTFTSLSSSNIKLRAYRTSGAGDQAISATTTTTVVFNAETGDTNSEFNTSTGVFTSTNGGTYLVIGYAEVANLADGGVLYAEIVDNVATVGQSTIISPSASDSLSVVVSAIATPTAGEDIKMQVYADEACDLSANSYDTSMLIIELP